MGELMGVLRRRRPPPVGFATTDQAITLSSRLFFRQNYLLPSVLAWLLGSLPDRLDAGRGGGGGHTLDTPDAVGGGLIRSCDGFQRSGHLPQQ